MVECSPSTFKAPGSTPSTMETKQRNKQMNPNKQTNKQTLLDSEAVRSFEPSAGDQNHPGGKILPCFPSIHPWCGSLQHPAASWPESSSFDSRPFNVLQIAVFPGHLSTCVLPAHPCLPGTANSNSPQAILPFPRLSISFFLFIMTGLSFSLSMMTKHPPTSSSNVFTSFLCW